MKNKKTNFIKLGILFFGISFLLWNCENEEKAGVNSQKTWKMKDISKTELNNKIDFNSFIKTLKPKKRTSNLSKKQNDTLYNFMIDYSTIREIQLEDKTSYTFKVIRENTSKSFFENLVVISSNNKIQNAYLIKYFPTKEIQHLENHNASTFEGNVNLIKLDLSNLNYNSKGTYCTDVWVAYCSWSYPHVAGPDCFYWNEILNDGRISYSLETICEDDGFIEAPIDIGGGDGSFGGGPGGDGDAVPTSPIGITNDTDKCEAPPKGDLNGDCILQEYEKCMSSGININLFNNLDYSYQSLIQNFINENECNAQTKNFVNIAMEAINSGYDVDWDDKIINKLNGKAECVYDKLEGNDLRNKTIQRFVGKKAPVHLILKLGDILNPNVGGETNYGDSYSITITLDNDYMNNTPSLFVALIILHEAIHADIYRKIKTRGGLYYNSTTSKWELNGKEANFPTLFNYYDNYPNNPQHNFMADYYRNAMEQGLRDYANTNGLNYPDQLYKDLSWGGLEGTNAWKNMFADPVFTQNEQTRIKNAILTFKNSSNNECQ